MKLVSKIWAPTVYCPLQQMLQFYPLSLSVFFRGIFPGTTYIITSENVGGKRETSNHVCKHRGSSLSEECIKGLFFPDYAVKV